MFTTRLCKVNTIPPHCLFNYKMGFKTKIALLTAGWYFSSILLSIYNKHVISKLQIPYPLLMTSIHQILLYFISLLYIWVKGKFQDPQTFK